MAIPTLPNKNDENIIPPPQAIDAEFAVLGAMFIQSDAIVKVADILKDTDFYSPNNRNVFRVIMQLYMSNSPVDFVTVSTELKNENLLQSMGGSGYLTTMTANVSSVANVEHYAQIVKDKSILRQIISIGTNMVCYAKSNPNISDILNRAQSDIYSVSENSVIREFVQMNKLVHPMLEQMETTCKNKNSFPGLSTGFIDLDRMTAGLQKSDLILFAGRPSMGKTAFALNIAEHVAFNEKKSVAIFSLEMSKEALAMRLACSTARVDSHKARQGYISSSGWSKLTSNMSKLFDAPIFIDDSSMLNTIEMRTRARKLAQELKSRNESLSLIIVDYIQLMSGTSKNENRVQEVTSISRALKGLARDLNVPVIALSQLSRKTEDHSRNGHRPQLSDLRESGALEQDADVVGFVYREGYYKRDDPDVQKNATIIIAKQRNGPTGDIDLTFLKECTRFENKEYKEAEKNESIIKTDCKRTC